MTTAADTMSQERERAGLVRPYLRRIRPITSIVGAAALLLVGLVGDDRGVMVAALIAFTSAVVVSPAYVLLADRIGGERTMRMSVYVDAVIVAVIVSTLPHGSTYAIASMWAVVLAALLCTPRDTILVTLLSIVLVVGLAHSHGADDIAIALNAMILGLIGLTMAAVHRGEFTLARARARLERQLRDAQRLAKVGSWEYDARTDSATWSEEMYRILGVEGGTPHGVEGFVQLVVPEDRDFVSEEMVRAIAEHRPTSFEVTIRRPADGSLRTVLGLGELSSEEPEVFVGSLQDVTEQRRLEAMRTEFVAAASHELRTPTSIVAGFASTLVESWDRFADAERQRYVLEIDRAAQRLAMLIEDVLQVSQIETGQLRCEHEPFDVAREATDVVRSWPGELPIELDVEPDGGGPAIAIGDAVRTRQVLTNLLANAERHTPTGTRASVRVRVVDGHVELAVADDGPGIVPEDQGRIFDRFVRIDQDVVGTGLGLYLSRRLAEAQGGELVVESQPGHGATFTLRLPASRVGS